MTRYNVDQQVAQALEITREPSKFPESEALEKWARSLQGVAGSNPVSPTKKPPLTCGNAVSEAVFVLTWNPGIVVY
jgi:hypothetical protein